MSYACIWEYNLVGARFQSAELFESPEKLLLHYQQVHDCPIHRYCISWPAIQEECLKCAEGYNTSCRTAEPADGLILSCFRCGHRTADPIHVKALYCPNCQRLYGQIAKPAGAIQ